MIPLGFNGLHVRDVVNSFYPDRHISFVEIDNYEGPGSGLVTLKCEHLLKCPFIFVSNDTLIGADEKLT